MARVFLQNEIKKAIDSYQQDNIIAFPTDTVYGVGANIFNEEAIRKIYKTKHRPNNKPLAVLCANKQQILQVVKEIPKDMELLIEQFLPGALTVILPKSSNVPDYVTSGLDTIGVRIPKDEIALEILKAVGPLATTSANISSQDNIVLGEDVIKLLGANVDIIINGGLIEIGIPSTVVTIEDQEIKVLREGSISLEEIKEVLEK